MNARSFLLPLFFFGSFSTYARPVTTPPQPTPEMRAVEAFCTSVAQQVSALPNPLNIDVQERERYALMLESSVSRIISLLAYSPQKNTLRLINRFFSHLIPITSTHVFTTPRGKKAQAWSHEIMHYRRSVERFSLELEKAMFSTPRNADLALQMAYDMSIAIMCFKQLFVPAGFPTAPLWKKLFFNLKHHKKTQRITSFIVCGTSLACLSAGIFYALRKEQSRHHQTANELTVHTARHEKALNAFIRSLKPTSEKPLDHAAEVLTIVEQECERLEAIAQVTPIDRPAPAASSLPHQLYTKIKYLHTLYRFVGQKSTRAAELNSQITHALGSLLDAEAGLTPNHLLTTPLIQARVLLDASQQPLRTLPVIQENSAAKAAHSIAELCSQLDNITEEQLSKKVSNAIKELSARAPLSESIEINIRTLQSLIKLSSPTSNSIDPSKILFFAAIATYKEEKESEPETSSTSLPSSREQQSIVRRLREGIAPPPQRPRKRSLGLDLNHNFVTSHE